MEEGSSGSAKPPGRPEQIESRGSGIVISVDRRESARMINPTSIITMPSAHGSYQPVKPVRAADATDASAGPIETRRQQPDAVQPSTPPRIGGEDQGSGRIIDAYA